MLVPSSALIDEIEELSGTSGSWVACALQTHWSRERMKGRPGRLSWRLRGDDECVSSLAPVVESDETAADVAEADISPQ